MIEELKEFKKGESLIIEGNFEKAIIYFESIITKSEYSLSYYKLYYKIGQCYYMMGCTSNKLPFFQLADQYLLKAKALIETNFQPTYIENINGLFEKVETEMNKFKK